MADSSGSDNHNSADSNRRKFLPPSTIGQQQHHQHQQQLKPQPQLQLASNLQPILPPTTVGQDQQQGQYHQQQLQQPFDISQLQCDNILRQILNEKKINLMKSPEVKNFLRQIAASKSNSSTSNTDNNKLEEI